MHLSLNKLEYKIIVLAMLLGVTSILGTDLYVPSLPIIVSALHTNKNLVQFSVTLYLLSMLLMQLIYGPLSDKTGRKPIILFGLAIAPIGSIICCFSNNIILFLIGRAIQGAGAAVGMSFTRILLSDILSREKISIYGSYVGIILIVGMMTAPVIGGYLAHTFNWHANFIFLSISFALSFIIFSITLPETVTNQDTHKFSLRTITKNYATLLRSRVFLGYTSCSGIAFSTIIAYITLSPFIFQLHYHISIVVYGWLGFMISAAAIIGKFSNTLVVQKLTVDGTLWLGLSFFIGMGIVLTCLNLFWHLPIGLLVILIFICTIGQGFIFANAMAGALSTFRHIGGSAGALFSSTQYGFGFLVGSIIALLPSHTSLVLSLSYLILGILGAIIFFLCVNINNTVTMNKH